MAKLVQVTLAFALILVASACSNSTHPTVLPSRPAIASSTPPPTSEGIVALRNRPLHFPQVLSRCPASPVRSFNVTWGPNGGIGGSVAGSLPVVGLLAEESRPLARVTIGGRVFLHRAVVRLGMSSVPGWGALKTTWISTPAYKGPYIVRGRRLNGPGEVRFGDEPRDRYLAFRLGPDANAGGGYRAGIGYVWTREPGCYGFQIDGTSFSHVIVVDVLNRPGKA